MARKSKNNIDDNAVILVFAAIGTAAFAIIEAILYIVFALVNFVRWANKKLHEKGIVKVVVKEPFKNSNINFKKKEIISKETILKKLNLFNMDNYNYMFLPKIRPRGEDYYMQNRIKSFKQNGTKYSCKMQGSEVYNVSVLFNGENNDIIEKISCTCPFHIDGKRGCKHIYALVYNVKCSFNRETILYEINNNIEAINKMIILASHEFQANCKNYNTSCISKFVEIANINLKKLTAIEAKTLESERENALINVLIELLCIKMEMIDIIRNVFESEYQKNQKTCTSTDTYQPLYERENEEESEDIYANEYGYTKEQLEHLEPWQLELVKKGEYDPSGFEEQELEDDDWHSDDEDETIK